jgi:hypothetical protein
MHSLTSRRPVKSMKFMTALGYPALALLAWLALSCMPMAEKSEESAISPVLCQKPSDRNSKRNRPLVSPAVRHRPVDFSDLSTRGIG